MKELVPGRPRLTFEYKFLTKESQRETIKRRALDLVREAHGKDMVVFLDKSARPLSQMLITLYPYVYPGEVRPAVRFVNVGSEKSWPIICHLKRKLGHNYSGRLRENLGALKSQSEFIELFGQENTDYLRKLLQTEQAGGQRLVVDDLIDSGTTRAVALAILSVADRWNHYHFFPFLESDCDRSPFCDRGRVPFLPWHSSCTLVVDAEIEDDLSFRVNRQEGGWRLTQGLVVRRELHQLGREIISDPCV